MSELETMLRASCDLIDKDREIASLKVALSKQRAALALKDAQIATLQCRLQRRQIPFNQRTPALLRPQA
jgi:hypothetical protein